MDSCAEQARDEARTENHKDHGDYLYRDSRRRQFAIRVHDLR